MALRPSSLLLAAVLLSGFASGRADAAEPALRGDVLATRDVLTVADLVEGAPPALAATPLFRAPALGATGTIQARRILQATEALGLSVQTAGRAQVTVTRAARLIGPGEIEGALRKRLAAEFGLDPGSTGIEFDGTPPTLAAAPDAGGEATASELSLDRRTRRVSASVWLGPTATERRAQLRVTGTVIDLVEVAVSGRALDRGQALRAGDVVLERRPRSAVPADAVHDGAALEGRQPRRAVAAGTLLRPADLIRPELVGRGDVVTATYEGPGVSLSIRVRSSDAGALGDTVSVVNPQSKKTLQAVVTGPGRVSVGTPGPGRIAAAGAAP